MHRERNIALLNPAVRVDLAAVELLTAPADMLTKACAMEQASVNDYNQAAQECGANADAATKGVFEELVGDEEGHFAEFDKELDHLGRFGPAYLALQTFGKEVQAGSAAK